LEVESVRGRRGRQTIKKDDYPRGERMQRRREINQTRNRGHSGTGGGGSKSTREYSINRGYTRAKTLQG